MRLSLLVLAAGASFIAGPALARDGAWYVGGDFGAMIVEDTHVETGAPGPISLNYEYGYGGGLFVGHDLGAFRVEAEVSYRRANLEDLGLTPAARSPGDGYTSNTAWMINGVWDPNNNTGPGFAPNFFVGGGLGFANAKFFDLRPAGSLFPAVDGTDTSFAWQVFGGVRQPINDNWDFSLKYNYSGSSFDVDTYLGGNKKVDFRSHNLLAGVSYNFGSLALPADSSPSLPSSGRAPGWSSDTPSGWSLPNVGNGYWYGGLNLGANGVHDLRVDSLLASDYRVKFDHGWDVDGSLGYDLGSVRLEGEVGYRSANVSGLSRTTSVPLSSSRFDASGRASALSFMINGMLDFGDEDGVSGFVGGGAGIARVDYNNIRAFGSLSNDFDGEDTKFAWQVVAGLRYPVRDNIDVTLKYRFFDIGQTELNSFAGIKRDVDFRSHSLLAGVTFNFGAPPPPPPPPAPPP